MGNNIKYARKFIILKKEYSNMSNFNPKGHGKIELRGPRLNILLNIENGEKDSYYNIILLSGIRDYELGKIYLENDTRGKVEFKLNYKDLEAAGFSIDKINAILIFRDEKILLGNYINKKDGSMERYISENIEKNHKDDIIDTESQETQIDKEDIEDKEKIEEISIIEQEMYREIPDIQAAEENQSIGEFNPIINQEHEDLNPIINDELEDEILEEILRTREVEEDPIIDNEISEREYEEAINNIFEETGFEEVELEAKVDIKDKIGKLDKQDQTTNYILNILSFFPYTDPFKMDLKGYNWWRIDTDNPQEERGFLPYFSYITGGNQKYPVVRNAIHANQLMEFHKHYIFGLYNEENNVKFYVYGIPGEFTAREHPSRGSTGFSTWFESKEGGGYWLLYIQPSTGRIIYPLNPMIPKD